MRIIRELREAEAALDTALLRQSSLLSTLLEARRDTDAGPFVGQEAMMRLTKSHQTLISAGSDLARVHSNLLKVQEDVLGYEDCPPNEPMAEQPVLREVS
ncbi:hypothetical protein [Aurantiacibacter rhizosphaerae]|uniref:Flagellar protein FlgN n=1 Tax=Aurantiacibacter rhizosphaerae TaxID=2691582 RepID=A0A844XDI3_9SPHN|nr:hypothetical protein [Aurantiacibacter rhizosphaerae]MWV27890.1 hypothetical protein [Aurantiacibacter rhizosphaerae]